jgi:hypothetical protein
LDLLGDPNLATDAGVLDLHERVLTGQALGDDEEVVRADETKPSRSDLWRLLR